MRIFGLAAIAVLALAGCSAHPMPVPTGTAAAGTAAPGAPGTPTAAYDTTQIHETSVQHLSIAGVDYLATSYENPAYACGRTGVFPFVVLEQAASVGTPRPLWAALHGGGAGYYDASGTYQGAGEGHNDQESVASMLNMALKYVGPDGTSDTFMGDRIRAGDRVAIGSLCDHDLMMGLGQPYPNNPNFGSAGTTVDGLLADLAMLDSVENGAKGVDARPTTSTWVIGTSAGSYGAYVLAHNRWLRGLPIDGVIMDSGLLTTRSFELFDAGDGNQAHHDFDPAPMEAKHGPYFTDRSLWAENAVAAGFDVPLFAVVETGDGGCGGRDPLLPEAKSAGYATNCQWLYGALGEAIAAHGDPATQGVHTYPGSTHTASDISGHPMQDDMRDWYAVASK